MTFVAIDVEHIVIQLYHRVIVPVFLKAVGAHVEPFGKWLGTVTNDALVDAGVDGTHPLLLIAEISWEIMLEPSMCSSARTKLVDSRNAVIDILEEMLLNSLHTGTEIL